jgi:hypothetical protein
MKRYMFTNFFIDTIRNSLLIPGLSANNTAREKANLTKMLGPKHGTQGLEEKVERYLSFKPPDFLVVTEFNRMLLEVQDAYVCGHFYPALTAACCIGERIFNVLILKLRTHYKSSPLYKEAYRKDSFDDWRWSIKVLVDWKVLPPGIEQAYLALADIRHDSIHFKDLADLEKKAQSALAAIMRITDALFGFRQDALFLIGHMFIRKEMESDPLVREFYLPASHYVGFKYQVENRSGQMVIVDDSAYEERDVTDEEFIALRQQWLRNLAN